VSYGVYISGPGIVGELLMRGLAHDSWEVYETETDAAIVRNDVARQRPYHDVKVKSYTKGDENLGGYASHPDGQTS
jgi:proteasome lid subunit RPN8/RPN11